MLWYIDIMLIANFMSGGSDGIFQESFIVIYYYYYCYYYYSVNVYSKL
jgi:hypothetical protein